MAAVGGRPGAARQAAGRRDPRRAHRPAVDGVTARITLHEPAHRLRRACRARDPLLSGATGRLWAGAGGRLRLELQSDSGDAQIVSDGKTVTVYDADAEHGLPRARCPPTRTGAGRPGRRRRRSPTIQDELAELAEHWPTSPARTPSDVAGRARLHRAHLARSTTAGCSAPPSWPGTPPTACRCAPPSTPPATARPVLELKATDISFGKVAGARPSTSRRPPDAKVTDVDAAGARRAPARARAPTSRSRASTPSRQGACRSRSRRRPRWSACRARGPAVDRQGDKPAALVTYGAGLGGIAVLEQPADAAAPAQRRPQRRRRRAAAAEGRRSTARPARSSPPRWAPIVRFTRGGVHYTVVGSVPPAAAEAAARGL